ncbi:MAG: sigma-70 family RNA polymerase sigma factor [Myxococcota bacterium]
MTRDDSTLLLAWRDGDSACGEELFERHYAAVQRFFSNKVQEDLGDLVQATFMACLEKVDGLQKAASFRSFLFGVARFELLHYYRRRSKRETPQDMGELTVFDLDPSPSRIIAQREEGRLLLEALRHIPIDLQIVLELTYWEQATSAEMADVLGIPEGTVKSRVRRARDKLELAMAQLAETDALLRSTQANLADWAANVRPKASKT